MFFTGQRWCFCFVVNARCCGLPDFRFWRGAAGGRGPQPGKLCRSWCGSHQNFSGGMSSTAGAQHAGAGNARAHTHLQEFLFDDLLFECVTSARVCLVRCIVWPCGPAATACLSDFVICSQISSRSFFVQFFFFMDFWRTALRPSTRSAGIHHHRGWAHCYWVCTLLLFGGLFKQHALTHFVLLVPFYMKHAPHCLTISTWMHFTHFTLDISIF